MQNKKGVSQIIGYVILISTVLIISAGVYIFLKSYIPRDEVKCQDGVSVSIINYTYENIASAKINTNLTIKNNGRFTIHGLYIKGTISENTDIATYNLGEGHINYSESSIKVKLEPGQEINFYFTDKKRIYQLEITPARIEEVDNKEIYAFCTTGRKILRITKENCVGCSTQPEEENPEILISVLEPLPASKGIAIGKNEMFELIFNVTCLEKNCGDVEVTLDPESVGTCPSESNMFKDCYFTNQEDCESHECSWTEYSSDSPSIYSSCMIPQYSSAIFATNKNCDNKWFCQYANTFRMSCNNQPIKECIKYTGPQQLPDGRYMCFPTPICYFEEQNTCPKYSTTFPQEIIGKECCTTEEVCRPPFMFQYSTDNPCAIGCTKSEDCPSSYVCSGGICVWFETPLSQIQNKRGPQGATTMSQIIPIENNWNPAIDKFYTNSSSNPTIVNLNKGESINVTFWVNATGEIAPSAQFQFYRYEFFAFANLSSNKQISNISEKFFVDVYT